MHGLIVNVGLADRSERTLADSFREVAAGHAAEGEVAATALVLASWSDEHVRRLAPVTHRYGEQPDAEPDRLHADVLPGTRSGPVGLVRDLQDLHLLSSLVQTTWTVLGQAAMGAHDQELETLAVECGAQTKRQLAWCLTHLKVAAPQALLAAT